MRTVLLDRFLNAKICDVGAPTHSTARIAAQL